MLHLSDREIWDIQMTLKNVLKSKYRRWCRRLGWSSDEITDWAEEVAGEGIAIGLKDIESWKPELGEISVWFYLKAHTKARNELRALEAAKRGGAGAVLESAQEVYDPITSLLERAELKIALQKLKPIQREVLVLYEYVGMAVRDIALLTGCPSKTVYTHLDRARKKASLFYEQDPNSDQRPKDSDKIRPSPKRIGTHETRPPPHHDQNKIQHDLPTRRPK